MRKRFLQFSDSMDWAARVAVIVLMATMCVVVLLGVFFRYVLGDALTWSEEVGRYLMIWMGFVGLGPALREGGHIAIDSLLNQLPQQLRRSVILLIRLLCIAFLVTVVCAGAVLIPLISAQITPVLGISTAWPYLAIPVGCLLTIIDIIALMIRDPDQRGWAANESGDTALAIRS